MPVLATYFSIRRGRDPFFKFFMRTIFPRTVKEYEKKFGIKFIGWYNVAHGWDFDNVIMFDLPDYGTFDKLEAVLGYAFRDRAVLAQALRHASWCNEAAGPRLEDNERLEFLGDAVLDLVVGHRLMTRSPQLR